MGKKERILEAWIMVEHLSEGDINLKDTQLKKIETKDNCDYYSMFCAEIQRKELQEEEKRGLVLYLNIFPFEDVVTLIREKYKLPQTNEEVSVGDKFSIAIYFDKNLRFVEDMTFFTVSSYILEKGIIPREKEFSDFERENKKQLNSIFSYSNEEEYQNFFNKAFVKFLNKYSISLKDSQMKVLNNLETAATNLHSFFIQDLEKAKDIKTKNIEAYLLGEYDERNNLDSRSNSSNFNPSVFEDVLQPKNYPVSRFPSNTEYSLSLMQQVAVNLAIGYDNKQIRSVNGPPGTGKTTLLKDIFAEFVVDQAYEIACLSEKRIKGSEKTKYWDNASIGILPEKIAEKGIVVASSNNGAVQNIVNELPLLTGIAEEFHTEIVEADYFYDIANSKLTSEWEKDENGKSHEVLKKEKEKENKFWGLFSLEGGRKGNVDYIITALKHVVEYLENEYIPNDKIYSDFVKQYEEVCAYRNARQTVADEMNCLTNKQQSYNEKKSDRQVKIEKNSDNYLKDITSAKNSMQSFENEKQESESCLIKLQDQKGSLNQCIEALKLQKPGFFSFGKVRKEYKKRCKKYSDELEELILAEQSAKKKVAKIEKELKELQINITNNEAEMAKEKKSFEEWDKETQSEIVELEKHVEKLKQEANCPNIKGLNLKMDYDSLQLSNPWFDKKYRELQSRLFIASLKVRKEFLYKNLKNIRAAYKIWEKQRDYLDQKVVISEAWNWMNIVIPVISSTFASFSRMCANLGPETIGSLFVDEAGQALPQASVGAIFRSKHVMVVGDPSQIKPVLTLDSSVLNTLRQCYDISQKYLSEDASTQTLVDAISRYGFYKDDNKEEWIGIPLWVHRRCKHPMFDIANKISYGGNMVQGSKQNGMAQWFDIGGSATDKYVEKQGEFLQKKNSGDD